MHSERPRNRSQVEQATLRCPGLSFADTGESEQQLIDSSNASAHTQLMSCLAGLMTLQLTNHRQPVYQKESGE